MVYACFCCFFTREKVEYIEIEPYEIKDEEDEDVVLPNESNFDVSFREIENTRELSCSQLKQEIFFFGRTMQDWVI